MTSTTPTTRDARQDDRLATGYAWDADAQRWRTPALIGREPVGPAGALHSTARDMAAWLRLQLGRGTFEGETLLQAATHAETWAPQITVARDVAHGLGWRLGEIDGHPVVEHDGSTEGFSAQVGLFPDDDLGFVLLTNVSSTGLPRDSLQLVLQTLLDARQAPAVDATTGEDLTPFLGRYIANHGGFDDARFEVRVQDGRLTVDIPGQRVYALEPPDATGRRPFAVTDTVAIRFSRNGAGEVVELHMEQTGMTFDCRKEGAVLEPEIPLDELQPYLGRFRDELGQTVSVVVHETRLAVDPPGRNLFTLHVPDAQGRRPLRLRGSFSVTFDEQTKDSFVFDQGDTQRTYERIEEADDEPPLPSVDELLALRRTEQRVARRAAAGGRRLTGRILLLHSGLQGDIALIVDGDRYARRMRFGDFGRSDVSVLGERGQVRHGALGVDDLSGDDLLRATLGHPDVVDGDWRRHFDDIQVVGTSTWETMPVWELRLTRGELPPITYLVSQQTGDVVEQTTLTRQGGQLVTTTIGYKDHRDVDGLRVAHYVESRNASSGKTIIELERVETGLVLDEQDFRLD